MSRFLARDISYDRDRMGRRHALVRIGSQGTIIMGLFAMLTTAVFPLALPVMIWVGHGMLKKLWGKIWKASVSVIGYFFLLGTIAGIATFITAENWSPGIISRWYLNICMQVIGGIGVGILWGHLWWLRVWLNQPTYKRLAHTAYTRTLLQATVSKFWWKKRVEKGSFAPDECIVYGVESDRYSRGIPVYQRMEDVLHMLILGRTGSGKSQTMLRVILSYMRAQLPGIIIDMKGDPKYRAEVKQLGESLGVRVYEWSLGDEVGHYDPLASEIDSHSQMELVINSLEWNEAYYRNIASDALKVIFDVLEATGPCTVEVQGQVVRCSFLESAYLLLDPVRLSSWVQKRLGDYLLLREDALALAQKMKKDPRSYSGLVAQLKPIVDTKAGIGMRPDGVGAFNLRGVFDERAVVIISLNSLEYTSLAKMISALVMNDVKKMAGGLAGNEVPWLLAVDEFSHAGAHGFDAMLQQSRSSGARLMISTQAYSDIVSMGERIGSVESFAKQVAGQTSTTIFHNVDADTAAWAEGRVPKRWDVEETETSHKKNFVFDSDSGAVADQAFTRWHEVPAVSADAFKELEVGEFIVMGNFLHQARSGDFVSSRWEILRGMKRPRQMLIAKVKTVIDEALLSERALAAKDAAARVDAVELERVKQQNLVPTSASSGVVSGGFSVPVVPPVSGVGVEEFGSGGDWVE